MTNPYAELRIRARALALATLFDKPQERDVICDLLQLGLELEKIIEIASEPMLAMIRMQWWVDLFETQTSRDEAAAFAQRLSHYDVLSKSDLLHIVQQTQDSLQSPEPQVAWDAIFTIIAKALNWQISADITARLGRNFGALYQNGEVADYQPITDKQIKQASHGNYGFLRLNNYLVARQISGAPNQDFLLIFRYLLLVIR